MIIVGHNGGDGCTIEVLLAAGIVRTGLLLGKGGRSVSVRVR